MSSPIYTISGDTATLNMLTAGALITVFTYAGDSVILSARTDETPRPLNMFSQSIDQIDTWLAMIRTVLPLSTTSNKLNYYSESWDTSSKGIAAKFTIGNDKICDVSFDSSTKLILFKKRGEITINLNSFYEVVRFLKRLRSEIERW